MHKLLVKHTEHINQKLIDVLIERKKLFENTQAFEANVIEKLSELTAQGKKMRGNLLCFAYELFAQDIHDSIYTAAAAIELIHAGLLIHDDIMDHDEMRRGLPTIATQYKKTAPQTVHDATHYGNSLGICMGDISFFIAFELISRIKNDATGKIISALSTELSLVGYAQMKDVHFGALATPISLEEITHVYTHKTARYTFSLPLKIGALLAHAPEHDIKQLEKFGDAIGILFQIKDDEIGLFGDEAAIGKQIGSDITENKKTIYHHFLMQKTNAEEKKQLKNIFGYAITPRNLKYIHTLIEKYHIDRDINEIMMQLTHVAQQAITTLNVSDEHKSLLGMIISFNMTRTK